MIIKEQPEDFFVEEICDINEIKKKDEGKDAHYFYLTKRDYTQMKALEQIARVFRVSRKQIHFAGTKDRRAVTKQLISIQHINKRSFEENVTYFNSLTDDLQLEFLDVY